MASAGAVLAGVVLLAYAADQFIIGAARVAEVRRVSPLVIGIFIVGFGTSSPELLVSALASIRDQPAVAVGNIVGSNIANLTLLLGIGALLVPIGVDSRIVRREAVLVVAATIAFAVAVQGGGVGAVEGVVLLVLMAGSLLTVARRDPDDPLATDIPAVTAPAGTLRTEVARTVLGLVGTLAGAQLLLAGAVDLADRAGLSRGFVGATLVAVGTSLPELVTVIQSARRGATDLIVGNLLGSNLFNALAVGGVVGLTAGSTLDAPALTGLAAIAAVVVAIAALVAMRTGFTVSRREGLILIVAYAGFVALSA